VGEEHKDGANNSATHANSSSPGEKKRMLILEQIYRYRAL
jgi:hypothetical protein